MAWHGSSVKILDAEGEKGKKGSVTNASHFDRNPAVSPPGVHAMHGQPGSNLPDSVGYLSQAGALHLILAGHG